jgi:hypothetical protein
MASTTAGINAARRRLKQRSPVNAAKPCWRETLASARVHRGAKDTLIVMAAGANRIDQGF